MMNERVVIERELLEAIGARPVSGYRYLYSPTQPIKNTVGLFARFEVHASPAEPSISGEASFRASDTDDVSSSTKGPL